MAEEKIQINESLNKELEKKFVSLIHDTINNMGFDSLTSMENEISDNYKEISSLYDKAKRNVISAREYSSDSLYECQNILYEIENEYNEYKNKVNIINLINLYAVPVDNYQELLEKREQINKYLLDIHDEDFISMIKGEVDKQYSTIMKEKQDMATYDDLLFERDKDEELINRLKEENNSSEFVSILSKLLENEKKRQKQILEEQKRIEEEERQKKLEIERKRQEEIAKRQRIIEENRKKEIEKRTKELLYEQNNSVLNSKKDNFSFETIKDNTLDNDEKEDEISYKNKFDIEKELFDEFKINKGKVDSESKYNGDISKILDMDNDISIEEPIKKVQEEKTNDNAFPLGNIDDYIKNFDESKVDNLTLDSVLGDDFFPDLPQ